ncbi:MAG: hypothetical protein F4X69_02655 [Gemmatimonadetes bacterium]|nr:hypothetical protein [Gemmatimonadota bacterium]
MSNEIHIGIIEERKNKYPARSDRPPETTERLEYMKHLIAALPEGLDAIARHEAERFRLAMNFELEVDLARRSQIPHKRMKEVLRNLRPDDKRNDRSFINDLPDFTITWILDVATGESVEPKSVGRNKGIYTSRDLHIGHMVECVHDTMKLPYESEERYSACHEVADYLDMKYGKVRTIWRKIKDRVRKSKSNR